MFGERPTTPRIADLDSVMLNRVPGTYSVHMRLSSNLHVPRPIAPNHDSAHPLPVESAPNSRPESIGTGVNTHLRQAITLR